MMRLGLSMIFPTKNVPEEVAQAAMDYKWIKWMILSGYLPSICMYCIVCTVLVCICNFYVKLLFTSRSPSLRHEDPHS